MRGQVGVAPHAVDRGDVDDPAPPPLDHPRQDRPAEIGRAGQVGHEDTVPFLRRQLEKGPPEEDPRVVDQDVHRAELLLRARHAVLGRAALRDVGGQREAGDVALLEQRGCFMQLGLGPGHERHARALLAEARRD